MADLRPRARTLCFLTGLSIVACKSQLAEGYLLELLSWCAFSEYGPNDVDGN